MLVTLMLAVRMTQSAAETARKYENAIVAQELEAKKSELERRLERAKLPDSTDEFLDEAIKLDPTEIAARLRAAKRKLTAAEREKARLEEERAELDESATEREKLQKGNSKLEEEIEEEREKKEEALESSKEGFDKGVMYQFPNSGGLRPWFVDFSEQRIIAHSPEDVKKFSDRYSFLSWAKTRSSSSEYFVLICRPSGISAFEFAKEKLTGEGYRIGVDLVGETRELEFLPEE